MLSFDIHINGDVLKQHHQKAKPIYLLKRPVAYYHLLLYISVMFRPLIPIINDAVAHTFNESMHIATIHAKYGNDHLEKEIADSGDESNAGNKNIIKDEDTVPLHIAVTVQKSFTGITLFFKKYFLKPRLKLPSIIINKLVPPPKFSAYFCTSFT